MSESCTFEGSEESLVTGALTREDLGTAGVLFLFAARHWVCALSDGRQLPYCVGGSFCKNGAAGVFESCIGLMRFLRRQAIRRMTFGPMANVELTSAERLLIQTLQDLQIGLLGSAWKRVVGLVDESRTTELLGHLESIATGFNSAGLTVALRCSRQPFGGQSRGCVPAGAAVH